jgi:hypothetical protein
MSDLQTLVKESHAQAKAWFYGELNAQQEFNTNDRSREVIKLFAKVQGGECWLGKINLYDGKPNPPLWKWDGDMVYNFGAAFVIPSHDAELEKMILARYSGDYEGVAADRVQVDAICSRIEKLGGEHLYWC